MGKGLVSEKNFESLGSAKVVRGRVLSDGHIQFRDVEVPNAVSGRHPRLSWKTASASNFSVVGNWSSESAEASLLRTHQLLSPADL
jgi:hypothetical protein